MCLETIYVYMCVFMSVVTVWGSVEMFVVKQPLLKIFFSIGVLKYVVCLWRGCDGCCVFCLYCDAWSCRCSYMGCVTVSSCRCCMFVSCVHPVAVLNAAFCMACCLLILVEDAPDRLVWGLEHGLAIERPMDRIPREADYTS